MQLDQPITEKEFDELDQFLLSDRCADDAMTMDSLHGYLTAIAIGPVPVVMAEWLPHIWGTDGNDKPFLPKFKNDKEFDRIANLIVRFMNEIVITLEVAPKEFEPLFCQHEWEGKTLTDGEAWAWGFWEGMQLRQEAWEPIFASEQAALMRPIYLLGADEIEEEETALMDNPAKCHQLSVEIEANLPLIHRFFVPLRKSGINTVKREAPKMGRNDDCSCGSGKKFKKCCGAEPTIH
jgi:uncharacterized protein